MKFVEMTPGHWIRRSSVQEVRLVTDPVVEFGQRPSVQVKFKSGGPSVWNIFEFTTAEQVLDRAGRIIEEPEVVLRMPEEDAVAYDALGEEGDG